MNKGLEEKIKVLSEAHKDKDLAALISLLAQKELQLEQTQGMVEELNKKLSEYESGSKKAPEHPKVKVNKTTYNVTRGVQIGDKTYTKSQIAENKEEIEKKGKNLKIADYLVSINSGILKPE